MFAVTLRAGEKLVYSTRWTDSEADQSDRPQAPNLTIALVITRDERHEALSRRPSLASFLRGEVRSHAGAAL